MRTPSSAARRGCAADGLHRRIPAEHAGPIRRTDGAGTPSAGQPFVVTPVATLDQPWSMTFPPDGRALVAERPGSTAPRRRRPGQHDRGRGRPEVVDAGQGGFHDVILAPDTGGEPTAYLSWVEAGEGGTGGVVGRARLDVTGTPALRGPRGHLAADPEDVRRRALLTAPGRRPHRRAPLRHLRRTPEDAACPRPHQHARDTVRLTPTAGPRQTIWYAARGGVSSQIWSHGHRNPLGIAFDAQGRLWADEMGPVGGDEVNLIERGANYGWPLASNGSH